MFAAGVSVVRVRAARILDPYSGDLVAEDWQDVDRDTIDGVSWASDASTLDADVARERLESWATATFNDPDADVREGDRLEYAGRTWHVEGVPASDTNPFTGWRPTLVARVVHRVG